MDLSGEEGGISVKVGVNFEDGVNGVGGHEWEERSGPGPVSQISASGPPAKKRKTGEKGPIGQVTVPVGDVEGILSHANSASGIFQWTTPLLNPVVLINLFEVCPPGDLARFRLVCKKWHYLSLTAWRNSATLKLEGNSSGNGDVYMEGGTTLSQFVEYVEDQEKECGMMPFRRIKLQDWTFAVSTMQVKELWTLTGSYLASSGKPFRKMKMMDEWMFSPSDWLTERFWHLTGSHVTSVDLLDCRFSSAELWGIAYSLCPNLKRLCLRKCSFVGSSSLLLEASKPGLAYREPVRGKHEHLKCLVVSYSQLPESWLELLCHFESLTSLEVKGCSGSVIKSLLNAIKVIRNNSESELPLPIQHFDISPFRITHDRASHEKFFLVQELDLPLKSLIVRAHPDLDLDFVSDILDLHSTTLEDLELKESKGFRGLGRMEGKFSSKMYLDKLQELKIADVLLESTDILLSAPNLESLSISGEEGFADRMESIFDALEDGIAENTDVVLPKLRKLSYSGSFGYSQDIITLAKLMPNLEELKINVYDDKDFSTVCENWKGLKGLDIELFKYGGAYHLTDKGLTIGGLQIEKPEMKWVHKAMKPNITDLKELRSFSCLSKKFTEVAVTMDSSNFPIFRL